MKTLVVYFSQTGKTKALAGRIAGIAGADLVEIKTKKSYKMSYGRTILTSFGEIVTGARPELAMEVPDCQNYDRILIGFPIWCGTLPNAVRTFLDKAALAGKQAAIFTTSGATEPGKIAVRLKKSYPAVWHKPLNGNHASDEDIRKWLGK